MDGHGGEHHSKKSRKPYTLTKQRESWSNDEHERFIKALQLYNRDWKKIETYVGTKTVVQVRPAICVGDNSLIPLQDPPVVDEGFSSNFSVHLMLCCLHAGAKSSSSCLCTYFCMRGTDQEACAGCRSPCRQHVADAG